MKKLFLLVLFVLLFTGQVIAGTITLEWDANTEPDLAGYKLYYKIGSDTITNTAPYDGAGLIYNGTAIDSPIDVGLLTPVNGKVRVTLENIQANQKYCFAVTAYDNESPSLESNYGNFACRTTDGKYLISPATPSGRGISYLFFTLPDGTTFEYINGQVIVTPPEVDEEN